MGVVVHNVTNRPCRVISPIQSHMHTQAWWLLLGHRIPPLFHPPRPGKRQRNAQETGGKGGSRTLLLSTLRPTSQTLQSSNSRPTHFRPFSLGQSKKKKERSHLSPGATNRLSTRGEGGGKINSRRTPGKDRANWTIPSSGRGTLGGNPIRRQARGESHWI